MKTTHICKVLSCEAVAPHIFDMRLHAPAIAREAQPGQFLHIKTEGLLRRPISICDVSESEVRILFEAKGTGTTALSHMRVGDTLDTLGPLGNGFTIQGTRPIVIGGGIGAFPLLYLCKKLKNPHIFLGFRGLEQRVLYEEFCALGTVEAATDDGSFGHHGLVTDLVDVTMGDCIYACGPTPMLKTVQKIAGDTACQLSLEERMGCGIGGCAVCVCKSAGHFEKVCQKGPVFNAREVDFGD